MNPDSDPNPHEYGAGSSQPSHVGTWIQRSPASPPTYHIPGMENSGSYHGQFEHGTGEQSGLNPDHSHAFWSSQGVFPSSQRSLFQNDQGAHSHLLSGSGSSSYYSNQDLSNWMEMADLAPIEEAHHGFINFQGYEVPSVEELGWRFERYNTYPWQRALKESALKRIYSQIGSYWNPMTSATFQNSWNHVNLLLHSEPEIAQLVVHGDAATIRQVAMNTKPHRIHKSRADTPRLEMTMQRFLQDHTKGRAAGLVRTAIIEEPIHDENGDVIPNWLPIGWNNKHRKSLVDNLRNIWRSRSNVVESRLASYGRDAVAKYGPIIIGKDPKQAMKAAQILSTCNDAVELPEVKITEDDQSNKHPSWVPLNFQKDRPTKLVNQLKKLWTMDEHDVLAVLNKGGPIIVARYANRITGNSKLDATEAALEWAEEAGLHQVTGNDNLESLDLSTWAPDSLEEGDRRKLVRRLKGLWKANNDREVVEQLQRLEKDDIAMCASQILGSRMINAERASKRLRNS